MSEELACDKMEKCKPNLRVDDTDVENLKDLSLGEEVTITATCKVKNLGIDDYSKKPSATATFELTDIKIVPRETPIEKIKGAKSMKDLEKTEKEIK